MSSKVFPQQVENREFLFPVNTSYIPDELKQRAETELSEDDDTRINCLKLFRSMLRDQADFRWQDEELFLLAFLRARKYDVNRAFLLMKTMYKVYRKHDEIFYNFDFNNVRSTLQNMKLGYLPYRDSDGCAILVYQIAPWNPREVSLANIMLSINNLFHVAVRSPATQIAGIKLIIDFAGLSAHHIPYVSPSYMRLSAEALQNCFPARFRAVHVVNEGFLFSSVWAILKQFLSKKIKERWHFHGKHIRKLHKYISPSILPAEYQGELPQFENSISLKEAEKYEEYLTHVYSFGYQDYISSHERKNSSGSASNFLQRLSNAFSQERRNSSGNSTQTKSNFPQGKSSERKNSSEKSTHNERRLSHDFKNERKQSFEVGRRLSQGFSDLRRNSTEGLENMQRRLSQCFNHS